MIQDAQNVRIEGMELEGNSVVALLVRVGNVVLSDMRFLGNSRVQIEEESKEVSVRDSLFEGPSANMILLGISGEIIRTTFRNTAEDGIGEGWLKGWTVWGLGIGDSPTGDGSGSNLTLEDLTLMDYRAGGAINVGSSRVRARNLQVMNATIGIDVGHQASLELVGFSASGRGQDITGVERQTALRVGNATVDVVRSTFREQEVAVLVEGDCKPCKITESAFLGNDYDIVNEGPSQILATNNWWGDSGGPDAHKIVGNVQAGDWKTSGEPAASGKRDQPLAGLAGAVGLLLAAFLRRTRRRTPST